MRSKLSTNFMDSTALRPVMFLSLFIRRSRTSSALQSRPDIEHVIHDAHARALTFHHLRQNAGGRRYWQSNPLRRQQGQTARAIGCRRALGLHLIVLKDRGGGGFLNLRLSLRERKMLLASMMRARTEFRFCSSSCTWMRGVI